MTVTAERLQTARDLKDQISELDGEDDREIILKDTSTRRRRVTLYSMVDGEAVTVAEPLAKLAIEKRRPGGGYMFTARASEAPSYRVGDVKCFLHEASAERMSGVLAEAGLAGVTCAAEHLASLYSKRMHAKNRHGQQWAAFQEHIAEEDKTSWRERELEMHEVQKKQLEATLVLAGGAAPVVESMTCDLCGWPTDKGEASMAMHKRRWCKGAADAVTE